MLAPKYRLALLLLAVGCGGAPTIEGPAPALAPPPPPPSAVVSDRAPPGKLYRDEVVDFVDQGLPRFLQRVEVSADIHDGKFAGWLVRALYPREFWEPVDLQPGDVVTQVNGMPIERETQAYDAFVALKTAPRLDVSYTRSGEARTLSFEIIQRPGTTPQSVAKADHPAN